MNKNILSSTQTKALAELKRRVNEQFDIKSYRLYGSFVRQKAEAESDIDLLILTGKKLIRRQRHQITDIIFEINLKYDTNISSLVLPVESWEKGVYSVSPFKHEVMKASIAL